LASLVDDCCNAVEAAGRSMVASNAYYGTAEDESLLNDSRLPKTFDGMLRAVRFRRADNGRDHVLWVQWNCHPEILGSRNQLLTADFPYATIAALEKQYGCEVAYFSGPVGGLMAPPRRNDPEVERLPDGDEKAFLRAERYGQEVAALGAKATDAATPIELCPLAVAARPIAVPLANAHFHLARSLGVIRRKGVVWTGDFESYGPEGDASTAASAIETEVAYLRLGELHVAGIPGEIYPELVYARYPETPVEGVDFPEAPLERAVVDILPGERALILGLANDELGYIIPKRQWDVKRPYAYGLTEAQYGEINSCGPDVAAIISQALANRVAELSEAK
jgi:hypothetical protein